MGRGLMIVLAVSLGMNFFLAGFVFHDRLDGGRPPPPHAAEFHGFENPRALVGLADALPPESRQRFRAAFREHLPNMRAHHREVQKLSREMRAIVLAEEWDGAAFAAKMEEIREVRTRQQKAFDETFVAAISALSSEDRQRMIALADQRRKERRPRRGGPPPGHEGSPPGPDD